MRNILKADFRKYFNGKLFIATIILLVVFTALNAVINYFLKLNNEYTDFINPLTFLEQSFSPTQDFGILYLIFMIVILVSDFNHNTIRNKIIIGYDRNTIYLSTLIFTLTTTVISFLVYSLLNFLFAGLIFGFKGIKAIKVVETLLMYVCALIFYYCLVQLMVFLTRSTIGSIGIMIGLSFLIIIIISSVFTSAKLNDTTIKSLKYVIIFIPVLRLMIPTIGGLLPGLEFTGFNAVLSIFVSLVVSGILVFVGLYLNKKLDYN